MLQKSSAWKGFGAEGYFRMDTEPLLKECLNTSVDTSKKNNNIKTHPLLSARDELELKICNFLNFFHNC